MLTLKVVGFFLVVTPVVMVLTHLVAWIARSIMKPQTAEEAGLDEERPETAPPEDCTWRAFVDDAVDGTSIEDFLKKWRDHKPVSPGRSPLPLVPCRWYRLSRDGSLLWFDGATGDQRPDPWGRFWRASGTPSRIPLSFMALAVPAVGERWLQFRCAEHSPDGGRGEGPAAEGDPWWTSPERSSNVLCGCMVPVSIAAALVAWRRSAGAGPEGGAP